MKICSACKSLPTESLETIRNGINEILEARSQEIMNESIAAQESEESEKRVGLDAVVKQQQPQHKICGETVESNNPCDYCKRDKSSDLCRKCVELGDGSFFIGRILHAMR